MKIGILGAGTWGTCLTALLASKGYEVAVWVLEPELRERLTQTKKHPKLPDVPVEGNVTFLANLAEVIHGRDLIAEAVTSSGVRPVFSQVKELGTPGCPIVVTSKGIEQGSGLLLPGVVAEVLGEENRSLIGCLSGPSHAEEVIRGLPTSVVGTAYHPEIIPKIVETFTTPTFRVYPNSDINGVAFGGAMKNVIAIACGISDGLGFGDNTRAALMTRGLHEIRKLSVVKGCNPETLNGLAGMGDLCVTCMSTLSRNYQFGRLMATGMTSQKAKDQVGMVVEGAYTCVSVYELSRQHGVPVPITEAIYQILYEDLDPTDAVSALMQRTIKQEHL